MAITSATLLAVFAGWGDSTHATTQITGLTVAGSSILANTLWAARSNGNWVVEGGYYQKSPAAATPTITANFAGGVAQVALITACFTGVDTTTTFGTSAGGNSNANKNATTGAITSSAGEWVIGFCSSDAGTIAEGATLIQEVEGVGSDTCYSAEYSTSTSPTLTWTGTGGDNGWACDGIPIKPSGGGGGGGVVTHYQRPYLAFQQTQYIN